VVVVQGSALPDARQEGLTLQPADESSSEPEVSGAQPAASLAAAVAAAAAAAHASSVGGVSADVVMAAPVPQVAPVLARAAVVPPPVTSTPKEETLSQGAPPLWSQFAGIPEVGAAAETKAQVASPSASPAPVLQPAPAVAPVSAAPAPAAAEAAVEVDGFSGALELFPDDDDGDVSPLPELCMDSPSEAEA